MSVPDAFLHGKLVDENDLPPRVANLSVLTEGSHQGKRGFVRAQGDHRLENDGTFRSPGLVAGKYYLRFFGMLRGDAASGDDMQRLAFDFIYPDAETMREGSPIELENSQSIDLVFRVPKPKWFNIGGRIEGNLGISNHNCLSVLFQRDMGILPDVGEIGFPVNSDGSFHGMLLKGKYNASVHEMEEQQAAGFTRSVKRIGAWKFIAERDTLNVLLRTE